MKYRFTLMVQAPNGLKNYQKKIKAYGLFESVKDRLSRACLFCSTVFGAKSSVQACKVKLLNEFEQHISVKRLLSDGFQIMTSKNSS